MKHEEHQGEKRDILLSGTPFGKEELLVGKQLHERTNMRREYPKVMTKKCTRTRLSPHQTSLDPQSTWACSPGSVSKRTVMSHRAEGIRSGRIKTFTVS